MKTLHFKHQEQLSIIFNNAPRSKAMESVCLFLSHVSSIATQSPRRERLSTLDSLGDGGIEPPFSFFYHHFRIVNPSGATKGQISYNSEELYTNKRHL